MALKLDAAARSLFLGEFFAAFALTLRYVFKPKATLNYPHEKSPLSPITAEDCCDFSLVQPTGMAGSSPAMTSVRDEGFNCGLPIRSPRARRRPAPP